MSLAPVFHFPVPVFVSAVYMSVQNFPTPGAASQGPEWLMGVVAGIWLVVWLLDKAGKLPGGGIDRRQGPKFEEEDRKAIIETLTHVTMMAEQSREAASKTNSLHGLLTFRSDEDGIERWLRHHQITTESHAILQKLVELTNEVSSQRREDNRRTGILVTTLESIQKTLTRMERQYEELDEKVDKIRRGA